MYLPDFEYYAPATLAEACELLAKLGPKAKVLAGGTDVLSKMKQEQLSLEALVSIKKLDELTEIKSNGKGVVIGARATHNSLIDAPALQEKYPSICNAAKQMANNQIRNTGTVGGNCVNAVPSADLPPLFIALGAEVKLVGTSGERVVPLEDFFTGPNETVIKPDEILTEFIFKDQPFTGSNYLKFSLRRSGALAVAGVATAVVMDGDVCKEARIVMGAVAPTPLRAKEAEEILKGQKVTDELLEEAGNRAAAECKPISDLRGSEEYRRDLVRVLTKRSLRKSISEGHV
ncbi:MAG: xanthine dehydrogenase family protein subunit M [Firmicutes bacterium]|nr:xanthine dehydrogenase family protein subunit M [Bacillota bacterium]